jgi:hypothetical protein
MLINFIKEKNNRTLRSFIDSINGEEAEEIPPPEELGWVLEKDADGFIRYSNERYNAVIGYIYNIDRTYLFYRGEHSFYHFDIEHLALAIEVGAL